MGESYEIEEEVHPTVQHFTKSISEIELAKKLARYRELSTEIEALEASKDALRKELLELGKGEESVMAGGYVAFYKAVKVRESIDWKRYVSDVVGKVPDADLAPYTKRSEDTIRLEVKKIGS
jgi:hypothetical protein